MGPQTLIKCATCNSPCFIAKYCSRNWINILDSSKRQTLYRKGQYIFYEGNTVFGLYFINRGKVKVITTGLDGKEQIVRLANHGHTLGHRGEHHDTYTVSAVALTDSLICFVDNEILYETFIANPKFTYGLMMYYARELRKVETRTKYLSQMTVNEKVIEALLYMIEIFGINPQLKCIDVALSRQEIADIAGAKAEQVSRELYSLQQGNMILIEGKKILISNYQKLKGTLVAYDPIP